TNGKFRFFHGRHLRLHALVGARVPRPHFQGWRRALRNSSVRADSHAMPWGGPIFIGMFLTLFGFLGLVFDLLMHARPALSFLLATAIGCCSAASGVWLLNRYFAVSANEVKGNPLPGIVGHVSLTIPENGVGAIAY